MRAQKSRFFNHRNWLQAVVHWNGGPVECADHFKFDDGRLRGRVQVAMTVYFPGLIELGVGATFGECVAELESRFPDRFSASA